MGKFLVINRPTTHQTDRKAVSKCVSHFMKLDAMNQAQVFPIVGIKGYATLVDVSSHEELKSILTGNAMCNIEQYTVITLGDFRD
jgi:hypothetical protein